MPDIVDILWFEMKDSRPCNTPGGTQPECSQSSQGELSGSLKEQRFFRKDYAVQLGHDKLEGRLVGSLECCWTSTYLFRQSAGAPNEAYFTRYFLQSENFSCASA